MGTKHFASSSIVTSFSSNNKLNVETFYEQTQQIAHVKKYNAEFGTNHDTYLKCHCYHLAIIKLFSFVVKKKTQV